MSNCSLRTAEPSQNESALEDKTDDTLKNTKICINNQIHIKQEHIEHNPCHVNPFAAYKKKIKKSEFSNSQSICGNQVDYDPFPVSPFALTLNVKNEFPTHHYSTRQNQKPLFCNCKRTSCLKLYCECYKNGKNCTNQCACWDCKNLHPNPQKSSSSKRLMKKSFHSSPCSFRAEKKVRKSSKLGGRFMKKKDYEGYLSEKLRNRKKVLLKKGCNCKKSGCKNNYCQCHIAGKTCTELCSCIACKNFKEHSNKAKSKSDHIVHLSQLNQKKKYIVSELTKCNSDLLQHLNIIVQKSNFDSDFHRFGSMKYPVDSKLFVIGNPAHSIHFP